MFDNFIGCETFLDDSISDVMISNDNKIYKKNSCSHGGGAILGQRKGGRISVVQAAEIPVLKTPKCTSKTLNTLHSF
jgi:hypothetical protein